MGAKKVLPCNFFFVMNNIIFSTTTMKKRLEQTREIKMFKVKFTNNNTAKITTPLLPSLSRSLTDNTTYRGLPARGTENGYLHNKLYWTNYLPSDSLGLEIRVICPIVQFLGN